MKWHVLFIFMTSVLINSLVHSAACDSSDTSTSSGAADGSNCTVTGAESVIQLNFISGFNNGSGLAAVGGNNGSTLGAQRKLSFIKAAETIANQVASTQTIIIDAKFDRLECDGSSAVLGSAGASASFLSSTPPAGILVDTWYPVSLLNDKTNSDMFPPEDDSLTGNNTGSDIVSQFNSDIGQSDCLAGSSGWYYGFNNTPSANFIGFTTVLLHEITHGLGFSSLVNPSTGTKPDGKDDIFSNFLYSLSDSKNWSLADAMSNAQRAASAISETGLLWSGNSVNAQAVGLLTDGFNNSGTGSTALFAADDKVEMYAPSPFQGGSSVSHFNIDVAPNELMEPNYTSYLESLGLALFLLQDIGWSIVAAPNNIPTITAVNQSTNEDIPITIDMSSWGADADGDTKTYSIISCATNITCSISASNLILTPAENHNASTNSITVGITDGKGGSANDSFNLTVVAQNDAPTWGSISTQNVTVDNGSIAINLSSFASDVDFDTLSYSEISCGSGLVCSISGSTLTLSATSNGGNSVVVAIQADDSNSGQADVNINVSITSANAIIISGIPLNPENSLNISNTAIEIDVSTVLNEANFTLDLDGSNVASLIQINGNTLTVAMPESGEFAGIYTLTIENSSADSPLNYELVRAPRLNFSATKLLENLSVQTLKIEGGAAGTIYTLSSDISELIISSNATAASDANSFNAATLSLEVSEIVSSTNVVITADSIYESAISTGISLEPARIHTLTMEDENESPLTVGTYSLDLTNLDAFNLIAEYSTDNSGEVSVNLPDNNTNYTAEAQHSGYVSRNVSLLPSQLGQVVTLQTIPKENIEDFIIGTSKGGSLGLGALMLFILAGIHFRSRQI
jgi:predicted transglutaminase-like cysteine proteinase